MRTRVPSLKFEKGFTLMELVIVMTVMAILLAMALPIYVTHVKRAKEIVLKQDLDEMCRAIDKYTIDKERAPQSLQDLVGSYLRAVPVDPITKSADTWQVEMETEAPSPDVAPGIINVRSGAEGNDTSGRAYSEY
ncbi:MAG TPA: prepilin-type N-terminal cleavage/methylation domain-containing protein [Blastocatellia bacterium]|nr:prepilin-type N-terminal cleavage/methylation domain-containing protein [Blastocatellia bacterium]